ncbi:short-chain fatty acid transporter [Zobellella aerophila]
MQHFMQRLGDGAAAFSLRWIPAPFSFAIVLTILVYLAALLATERGPIELVDDWYGGFWNLLAFGMQMVLIVVTGYGLATSPPVQRALRWLSARPRSAGGAVAMTAAITGLLAFLHWGVALVVGAFLAKEVAKSAKLRGLKAHFPLIAAAGYGGAVVSQTGLSSSAALLVNTPGHFLEDKIGLLSLSETIFQPYSLVFVLLTLFLMPLLLASLHPRKDKVIEIADTADAHIDACAHEAGASSPAERLNRSRLLMGGIVAAGLLYVARYLADNGLLGLNLNVLNFAMLMLGMVLHGTLANYGRAIANGTSAASGIILQFPFYAGILGLMAGSGLLAMIANWFVSISTPETFPLWSMISAAIVNFAVPSAGGQWAIQGPIAVEAAQQLGLPSHVAVMTVMMGDQLTNLAQPFWLLPLLGITGLKVGQILGYTMILMAAVFLINAGCLLLLL